MAVPRPAVGRVRSTAARNNVNGADAAVSAQYPRVGRAALPVNDVGRLLLRCADRPGLVAAVSTFLAQAGANIVSLDQHSTEQSGGTFVQRTIFHLPGLTATRDAMERDFGEQVMGPPVCHEDGTGCSGC
jgi:hypothetical protein